MTTVDVAVVGGGPGGCAAAITLRAHTPGLSVVLLEASAYGGTRLGETLPPPAAAVLEHLGVAAEFAAQGHHAAYGTAAAWGSAAAHENDFVFHVRDVGWHLDRAAFDAMLHRHAAARGADARTSARVEDARRRAGGGWTLALAGGGCVETRLVVDATGAHAAFARRHVGARPTEGDRLAGFVRFFPAPAVADPSDDIAGPPGDPRTLVEAFRDGWWYTAPLPGGARVVACMTDSDIAREMGIANGERWMDVLRETAPQVGACIAGCGDAGPVVVRAARSRRLDRVAGADWMAVGDAASSFDPLSSQGITKALRSGIFAAYAAGDLLAKGDDAGIRRYERFVAQEFAAFETTRARYYGEERRWPGSKFWRRRQRAVMAA
ncbi:MAG TPA: FAD-dependent oxidoreductase [Longimicrobiaceae bacterium]|nr:FAD-dependent oxidoreductase [Longimicrobiaceae bacterium]